MARESRTRRATAAPDVGKRLARLSKELASELDRLEFSEPVTHVYNPVRYAWEPHRRYLERFARSGIEAVFFGMNPGPWGMAQTGVPFGEVAHVRDWLGIEGRVGKPEPEHPKRPVLGFACERSEVSGRRIWGWARARFGTPEAFFQRFFVWNWCPLSFMEEGGRNRTPDKLPAAERAPLEDACDRSLAAVVETLAPKRVIGVGAFAQKRAQRALVNSALPIDTILHPSPASPAANRGWAEQAEAQLGALGLLD